MKKNDWLLTASAVVFSVLFYKQSTGLNYLLFTLCVSALILVFNPKNRGDWKWWYYAILTNITGAAVVLINSNLSVFACITSLLVLSSKSFSKANSILVNYFFGVYSVLSSLIYWIIELSVKKDETQVEQKRKSRKVIGGVLIAIIIAIVFFVLYREANPLFKDLTKNINFDWISIGWIFFTFWGFLVMTGLLKSKGIDLISDIEMKANTGIQNNGMMASETQNKGVIAISLFIILNLMLIFLNGLDVTNIYITQRLPVGITLSDFVHQSVWSIVFSIVIAVALIMWIFNGDLNFSKQGKYIKYLVYLWIFQSALMIINTMVRNYWYISGYQLTYLRIGVFFFLTLSLIGLLLTASKIAYQRSAWRLVSDNFEVWFLILSLSTLLNWDNLITNYNIAHATPYKRIDKTYLLSLSDANIPQLLKLYDQQNSYTGKFTEYEEQEFVRKIVDYTNEINVGSWQSYNLRKRENISALINFKLK